MSEERKEEEKKCDKSKENDSIDIDDCIINYLDKNLSDSLIHYNQQYISGGKVE